MNRFMILAAAALAVFAGPIRALESSQGELTVETLAEGLDEPWSVAFLPDGEFLLTLRAGELRRYRADGSFDAVQGVPEVYVKGQGGLFDVLVLRDFAERREILLSYAKRFGGDHAGTALAVARLSEDGTALEDLREIFVMETPSRGGRHFGGRVVEAPDGMLFLSMGERGSMDEAQNLATHNGTIVRIARDGSVPEDNPFAGQQGALPEIWSYGHRNPQGLALDAEGRLWDSEHGAMGGDEVNLIEKGANYGWPVITYGRNYDGNPIGRGTEAPGMQQPAHYWDPSIAPSGHMIYSGKLWPDWAGHHFVGALKFDYIARLDPDGWSEEKLEGSETGRVRDIREAPDGSIWFLSVNDGALYRISPAAGGSQ